MTLLACLEAHQQSPYCTYRRKLKCYDESVGLPAKAYVHLLFLTVRLQPVAGTCLIDVQIIC